MIYKRYLFREVSKCYLLILVALFAFFLLAHLTAELKTFHQPGIKISHILLYQLSTFFDYLPLLSPIVMVIAAVKVYTSLALNHELVALTSGGIPKKQLVRPLLTFGALVAIFMVVASGWLFPIAHKWKSEFYSTYFKKGPAESVSHLMLPDFSEMVYGTYHTADKTLDDVYWLKSDTEIVHFKTLDLTKQTGHFADCLIKQGSNWVVDQSLETYPNIPITLSQQTLAAQLLPLGSQTLPLLWKQSTFSWARQPNRIAKISSHFMKVISLPFATLFAAIIPAPFCLRATRGLKTTLLFFWALAGGICYLVLVNVSCILGSHQMLPPLLAIGLPMILATIWSTVSYARLH